MLILETPVSLLRILHTHYKKMPFSALTFYKGTVQVFAHPQRHASYSTCAYAAHHIAVSAVAFDGLMRFIQHLLTKKTVLPSSSIRIERHRVIILNEDGTSFSFTYTLSFERITPRHWAFDLNNQPWPLLSDLDDTITLLPSDIHALRRVSTQLPIHVSHTPTALVAETTKKRYELERNNHSVIHRPLSRPMTLRGVDWYLLYQLGRSYPAYTHVVIYQLTTHTCIEAHNDNGLLHRCTILNKR